MNPTPSERSRKASHAPALVRWPGPLVNRMLRAGIGMGPNTRVTIRGRKTGRPHTTPLAVVGLDGNRWVVGAYGDVHWVRNLRATGQAEILVEGQPLKLTARELNRDETLDFFRRVVPQYAATRLPPIAQRFLAVVFRLVGASDILDNPERASERFPVFELRPLESEP